MTKIILSCLLTTFFIFTSCSTATRAPANIKSAEALSCFDLADRLVINSKRASVLEHFHPPKNKKIKVAFFDADGTVRIAKTKNHTAAHETDVLILPNVAQKLEELSEDGYFIAIVSNQTGISTGGRSYTMVDQAMEFTATEIKRAGGVVHYYDFAENSLEAKPNAHMGIKLEKYLKNLYGHDVRIDHEHSFMVGDAGYIEAKAKTPADIRPDGSAGFDFNNFDRLFAEEFNLEYFEPDRFFDWQKKGVIRFKTAEDLQQFHL